MDPLSELSELLMRLPGIGRKQARRIAYHIAGGDDGFVKRLSQSIVQAQATTSLCTRCFRRFPAHTRVHTPVCDVCASDNTDSTIMMVLEKDTDVDAVMRMHVYGGRYFVLGGTVPVVTKRMARDIRLDEFVSEVRRAVRDDGLLEVILGLPVNPDGEHTAHVLREALSAVPEIRVSELGRGLSTGTEIEYSDDDTMKNALRNRHDRAG